MPFILEMFEEFHVVYVNRQLKNFTILTTGHSSAVNTGI